MAPLERTLLVERRNPGKINATLLINQIRIPDRDRQRARAALNDCVGSRVLLAPRVLSADLCAALRSCVDDRVTGISLDSVDRCPEYQVDLTKEELEALIGREAVNRLWTLPSRLGLGAADQPLSGPWKGTVGVFARKYGPEARHHLGFHVDQDSVTANIALSDPTDYEGGNLLLVHGERVEAPQRGEGDATVHHGDVAHGVAKITQGARYSLILFFFDDNQGCKSTAQPQPRQPGQTFGSASIDTNNGNGKRRKDRRPRTAQSRRPP